MEEKKLTVTFVNVGYGEAILLESPDPSKPDGVFTALIDGGSAEDSEFADRSSGRVRLEEYLEKRGIRRLDLAVSTHIHEDHLCGLLRAARIVPPGGAVANAAAGSLPIPPASGRLRGEKPL